MEVYIINNAIFVPSRKPYSARRKIIAILSKPKKYVKMIDPWVSVKTLDYIFRIPEGIPIKLITSKKIIDESSFRRESEDLIKEKKGFFEIRIVNEERIHDRYIITQNAVWQCGLSLKDIGKKKYTTFTKIAKEDDEVKRQHEEKFDELWKSGRNLLESKPITPVEEMDSFERISDAAKIYFGMVHFGLLGFMFWIIDPYQWLSEAFFTFLFFLLVLYLIYYFRSWQFGRIINWCRRNSSLLVLLALEALVTSFVFKFSLFLYPALSRISFSTHLSNAPEKSLILFGVVLVATVVLYLPTLKNTDIGTALRSFVKELRKSKKKAIFLSILILLSIGVIPIDIICVIGTPKVGFVEKRNIIDDTIYIYEDGPLSFKAYVKNREIVHFLLPIMPIISTFNYSLRSNSTMVKPTIVTSSGIRSTLLMEGEYLCGLKLDLEKESNVEPMVEVEHATQMDIGSVATIQTDERLIQNLQNGTLQWEVSIRIFNKSPFSIYFWQHILIAQSVLSYVIVNESGQGGMYWYLSENRGLYLSGIVQKAGNYTAIVRYNEG